MGRPTSSARGNGPQGRGRGLHFDSERSGGPSSGLETPAGNALHPVGARAPVEDAAWLVVLGWTSQGLPSGSKGTFVTAVHFTVVSQESHSRRASPFMA